MAWTKIPAEHHALFLAALPRDRRVTTLRMFGATAAKVNNQLFGALFGRSMMVKLSPADSARAYALDGSEPFDPMGTGRPMGSAVLLGEEVMDDVAEMRAWLARAFAYTQTLPVKPAKRKAKTAAKPAPPKPTRAAAKTPRRKPAPRAR